MRNIFELGKVREDAYAECVVRPNGTVEARLKVAPCLTALEELEIRFVPRMLVRPGSDNVAQVCAGVGDRNTKSFRRSLKKVDAQWAAD